jgi:hypothetical protein
MFLSLLTWLFGGRKGRGGAVKPDPVFEFVMTMLVLWLLSRCSV